MIAGKQLKNIYKVTKLNAELLRGATAPTEWVLARAVRSHDLHERDVAHGATGLHQVRSKNDNDTCLLYEVIHSENRPAGSFVLCSPGAPDWLPGGEYCLLHEKEITLNWGDGICEDETFPVEKPSAAPVAKFVPKLKRDPVEHVTSLMNAAGFTAPDPEAPVSFVKGKEKINYGLYLVRSMNESQVEEAVKARLELIGN